MLDNDGKIKEKIKAEHDTKIKSLFNLFSFSFNFQRKIDKLLTGSSFRKDDNSSQIKNTD